MQTGIEQVEKFWNSSPCGSRDSENEEGSKAFFEEVERKRYTREPFIHEFAQFNAWRNKTVLEVGCGMGTDLLQFAKGGAQVYAVDLTAKGVALTKKRLELYGFTGEISKGDAEHLPYTDDKFDLVYSWGVIHHTPNIIKAIAEIYRVTKSGGKILVMIYHKWSLVSLQVWLRYGLFSLKPFTNIDALLAIHMESPGTKAFTIQETLTLFKQFKRVKITPVVTPYDLRLARRFYLPRCVSNFIPNRLGWFIVVEGEK